MTSSLGTSFRQSGSSFLVGFAGDLDAAAGPALEHVLDCVPTGTTVVLLDMHGLEFLDSTGLLLFLDLHYRAELRGLKVIVVGWQAQPRSLMEKVGCLPEPSAPADNSAALLGFRRMIRLRAERQRHTAAHVSTGSGVPTR
ncbi:STAS domain-containing protein [Streptomyces sp. NPDC001876]|uniref:STAS domain-containing protein n=1 Tax=Streptomyces sp. NPDC001876 TaxID=3154402 RepID=UPI00332146A9